MDHVKKEESMEGLGVGRIVHFSSWLTDGDCLAAIVTKVFNRETGCVNLGLFHEGGGIQNMTSIMPQTPDGKLPEDGVRASGTWHWPERV
jgi:hypothetical protein